MQTSSRPDSTEFATTLGTVAVTGGSSGLGAAIAAAIERHGGKAATLDLARTSSAHAGEHYCVDVADRVGVREAVARIAEQNGGRIDAVVANAGTDACGDFDGVDEEAWERVVRVNLLGTAALIRAALPYLERSNNPRILTVASTLGLRVLGAASAYCASKFGVVGFTRALALDLAGRVGVTLLCPGGMQTNFFNGREEQYKPAADAFERNQLNDPSQVAECAIFALTRPRGVEIREMIVTPSRETSWP